MIDYKELEVYLDEQLVGKLAITKEGLVAFEYDDEWLMNGFSISPFSLPLKKGVFVPKSYEPFEGLFGVFADSLPDGWGRLLVDRLLIKSDVDPRHLHSLNRLAIVGNTGMGALSYRPIFDFSTEMEIYDYDYLANECKKILNDEKSGSLDELFTLGGSSGGARPKILTKIDNEDWIIKFPSAIDQANVGSMEFAYNVCAQSCGIEVSDFRLFPSKQCGGYFGTKRFDRSYSHDGKVKRYHMVSVSALLETSHRIPNLDYSMLMKLTMKLTSDFSEVEKLFRLMCFNVFAHNRDDHSKNFSFLYCEEDRSWHLSPAYDLTYSNSLGGEHATSICGNGKNPTEKELLEIAKEIGMKKEKAVTIMQEIHEKVDNRLKDYL